MSKLIVQSKWRAGFVTKKSFFVGLALSFIHPIFRFWFLVTIGDEGTKIQKYYIIFVYILQGKMGKTQYWQDGKRKSRY